MFCVFCVYVDLIPTRRSSPLDASDRDAIKKIVDQQSEDVQYLRERNQQLEAMVARKVELVGAAEDANAKLRELVATRDAALAKADAAIAQRDRVIEQARERVDDLEQQTAAAVAEREDSRNALREAVRCARCAFVFVLICIYDSLILQCDTI